MKTFWLALCVLGTTTFAKNLPSFIPICQRNQATIAECLKKATVAVQPRLAKGIKELNIPPIEPLEIPMIKLEQGTGAVNYKITLTNLKVYGLSNYNFQSISADFSKNVIIRGNADLPTLKLVSEYDINGKVLLLPIQGNGEFTANITNCKTQFMSNADLVTKKGEQYLQTKDSHLRLQIGDAKMHFGNLFNGDPVLSRTTNNFLNDNAKEIVEEVKPAIEAVASMLIEDILNKVFKSAPYDKLFPK